MMNDESDMKTAGTRCPAVDCQSPSRQLITDP